jgi:FKBP-type peptidyl-prolyl cis-trans isomerase FkpA
VNKVFINILGLIIIALGFSACEQELSEAPLKDYELSVLESYLESEGIDAEPTESGLYYIENEEGTGRTPAPGDYVQINYSLYTIGDNQLVYSTVEEIAEEWGIYDDRILYGPNKIIRKDIVKGMDEGLGLMKEGGKATLIFNSDLGYGSEPRDLISPFTSLRIDVELLEVIKDPIENEYKKTREFISSFSLMEQATDFGIYFTETEKPNTDAANFEKKDSVIIEIIGKLLDGRVFYTNPNFKFQIGTNTRDVTPGLNEGLTYMREGSKAIIIVPYDKGFGAAGLQRYNGYVKTPIPPYSTLVYEVNAKQRSAISNSNQIN